MWSMWSQVWEELVERMRQHMLRLEAVSPPNIDQASKGRTAVLPAQITSGGLALMPLPDLVLTQVHFSRCRHQATESLQFVTR